MADLSVLMGSDISARIYSYHEKKAEDFRRDHLGASLIGRECERSIWYSFRWCVKPSFDGRMLRLFDTGKLAEERIFSELEGIGIKVFHKQKELRVFHCFGGSVDAFGRGFSESIGDHIIEVKTHSQKSFDDLVRNGVKESKPDHYAQMTVYMGAGVVSRAYYMAINKNTDEIYSERIKFDKDFYNFLVEKARRIIDSPTPCMKTESFKCKFCDYSEVCGGGSQKIEVSCRTCCHFTPFLCEKSGKGLTFEEQKKGCKNHLFIPMLIWTVHDAGDDWIEYEDGKINKNNSLEFFK